MQEIGGSAVGASNVRSLSIDEPFVRQMATGNEFYHTDTLGSSLAQSNAAGATTVSYSYEAFGKTTMTGTSSNPFQYTGRENDGTGLYYYRARYYRPVLQRFISEDPIGIDGDINLFAYVYNNPLKFVDTNGTIGRIPPLIPKITPDDLIPPPGYPNGNYTRGYNSQDNVCTLSGALGRAANSDPCVSKCCHAHDQCYEKNRCNMSSWRGTSIYNLPCQRCNTDVVGCVSSAIIKGCSCESSQPRPPVPGTW